MFHFAGKRERAPFATVLVFCCDYAAHARKRLIQGGTAAARPTVILSEAKNLARTHAIGSTRDKPDSFPARRDDRSHWNDRVYSSA